MKESSVVMTWRWFVKEVVAEAMGSSSSGLLNQGILDVSKSLPSGPRAQLSDAMVG